MDTVPGEGEMLPVVEPSGVVVAVASRTYCHKAGLLHPVVHMHLINRNGDLFLQKRSMGKETWPGRWDTAVGGHVLFGESLDETLYRESEEEIGLTAFNPVALGWHVFKGKNDHELVAVYAAVGNFDLAPCNGEVSEGKWWRMEEIEEYLGKSIFTPNFEQEFRKIRPSLEALL